jgi:hypothetical protein
MRKNQIRFKPKRQALADLPFWNYVSFNKDINMSIIHDLIRKIFGLFVKITGIRKIPQAIQQALLFMFATAIIMVITTVVLIDVVIIPIIIALNRFG